ncbi:oligopeptide ABC transporter permease [Entomoplasma ellychniae]|uniref:Oligopeptide ABC transporter permease n=1 Tax=Entomoplasma ellychniae TaxID=2114 RepID=A0A8E2QVE4_9MOLU|nr:oligopeptide ABC transporter permease OppC [Entomoplasma ellychniae]PPE04391.1 oligopeptide ABC transporter permease [Entomoplasma ellychniae]
MKDIKKTDIDLNDLDSSLFELVGDDLSQAEQIYTKPYKYWNTVLKKVFKSYTFIVCSIILLVFLVMTCTVALGESAVPKINLSNKNLPPSLEHWFGTGTKGEDLWNKVWIGSRSTMLFTILVFSFQTLIGITIGSIWGFYKKVDMLFLEIVRFLTAIPSLILWLVVIFIFNKGMASIVFAISLTSWIGLASLIRIQILLTRNAEYNIASKVLGSKGPKIIRKNIMPKILPIIIQTCAFVIPEAIAIDSTLAYLGFGFIPQNDNSKASLGSILNETLAGSDWQVTPHLLIVPLAVVGGISLVFYLIGKVLSDSLDPKTHR